MSEWQTGFQILLVVIGITSTIAVAYLFKYRWQTKQESIFQRNVEQTTNLIFYHLSYADSYKGSIFKYLEKQEDFDINSARNLTLPKYDYDEVFRFRDLILDEFKNISLMQKFSSYITLEQYLTVQKYVTSAANFIVKISNRENQIIIQKKTLEYHRYHAKKIIELFGETTRPSFREKWEKEFASMGGEHLVKEPSGEPGDVLGVHYNIHNELLFYDYTFSEIMNELAKIKEMIRDLKESDDEN